MRSPAQSCRLLARWALAGLVVVGCGNSEFLDGVECTNDNQCGRERLGVCEHGFCGGCPEGMLSNGECLCPGPRIFDCRRLGEQRCMPACLAIIELCTVALVLPDGSSEKLSPCDEEAERCFDVEPDPEGCGADQVLIELSGVASDASIVANCPPPESEDSDFDCREEEGEERQARPVVEEPACRDGAASLVADPASLVCTAEASLGR